MIDPTFAALPYRGLGDVALARAAELGATYADFRFERVRYQYLAAREGQVVSRSEISKHLYGQDDEASSNVVDVYIGYLRNKIDRDYPVKLIHTRRGLGYVLTASQ